MSKVDTFTIPNNQVATEWHSTLSHALKSDGWMTVEIQGVATGNDIQKALNKGTLEAKIQYNYGGHTGMEIRVDVSGAVRVPVFGSEISVEIANNSDAPRDVLVGVSEGCAGGVGILNHSYEVSLTNGDPQVLRQVPFGETLRLFVGERGRLEDLLLEGFAGGLGAQVLSLRGDEIPPGGIPLSGLHTLQLTKTAGDALWCHVSVGLSI